MSKAMGAVSEAPTVKSVATSAPAKTGSENENEMNLSAEDLIGSLPDVAAMLGGSTSETNEEEKEGETEGETEGGTGETEGASGETETPTGETNPPEGQTQEEETPTDWPESAHKRVGKLTAKFKEAEEKLSTVEKALTETKAEAEKMKAELNTLRATPVTAAPTAEDPLANLNTSKEVEERMATAERVKEWALENLEGATIKDKDGNDVELTAKDMRKHLAAADAMISKHGPRRMQFLQQKAAMEKETRETYPALFDSSTKEYQAAQQSLRAYPWLAALPNALMIIGDAIEGMKARVAKAQSKGKTASPPPKAPIAPKSNGAPPKTTAKKQQTVGAMKSFVESNGSPKALEDALVTML